ncbi:Crp/Fnr family transcriptional regulator [Flavobacteriaceae bacterium S0825]|uniref:Crp/Fnr family transcriptional regulator n=1 Tax=Gaetbulibacter sp. S0825 TaxID=2720084 RepID=UPI00142FD253|nr:Crp/Fnr family transcriptional regulator [Gaetbulibacter sp. S0825]MCK0109617.1 Crp/Fnr family transcriptional regulator [Flavobacteriaceae bacterium S0825]NIX65250.1 Crp/Fnr family transcriptional regulator [Gaetbulibacter sp. S0825]
MNANFVFLNSFTQIDEAAFKRLQEITSYRILRKNEIVAREGEIPSLSVYMLISGVMRAYISTESGKQYNKKLFVPKSFVGPLTAIITKRPSKLTYETLTECKVIETNFETFLGMCKTDIQLSNLYNKVLENIFMEYERRSLELMSLNATERYLNLRKRIPNIDELIPQFQIASFLNITPVQLSRVRKKLNYKHMLMKN